MGSHSLEAQIDIPDGAMSRQDASFVSLSDSRRDAQLVMKLAANGDTNAISGSISIAGAGLTSVAEHGIVRLVGIPSGSWSVGVRALGYEPRQLVAVATAEARPEPMVVLLKKNAQILEAMTVTEHGTSTDSKVLAAVAERQRLGFGSAIYAANLKTALDAGDAIRQAKGFIVKGPTHVEGRPYAKGMGMRTCSSALSNMSLPSAGAKQVAVYLDGNRMPGGLETVNNMIRPSDILVVETFADVSTAPVYWRTNDACAVVAFWTKH